MKVLGLCQSKAIQPNSFHWLGSFAFDMMKKRRKIKCGLYYASVARKSKHRSSDANTAIRKNDARTNRSSIVGTGRKRDRMRSFGRVQIYDHPAAPLNAGWPKCILARTGVRDQTTPGLHLSNTIAEPEVILNGLPARSIDFSEPNRRRILRRLQKRPSLGFAAHSPRRRNRRIWPFLLSHRKIILRTNHIGDRVIRRNKSGGDRTHVH